MSRRREVFECPHCGADVPRGARACRECGSDAATGWQSGDEIDYQSVELPDGGGYGAPPAGASPRPGWWLWVALLLAAALLVLALRR